MPRMNDEEYASIPDVPCECGCGEMIKSLSREGSPRRFSQYHGSRKTNLGRAMTQREIKRRNFDKKRDEAPVVSCACGCGQEIKSFDKYGRPQQYINGHGGRKYEDPKEYLRVYNQKPKTKARLYQSKKDRWRRLKVDLVRMLGGGCSVCGHPYNGRNAASFDFHHRDPSQKEIGFGGGWIVNRSWNVVVAEAAKCDLVCHRCHQLIHTPVIRGIYGERKAKLVELAGGACLECGFQHDGINSAAFDFHHNGSGQKLFTISQGISRFRFATVAEETSKCDLLCRNCHPLKHSGEY